MDYRSLRVSLQRGRRYRPSRKKRMRATTKKASGADRIEELVLVVARHRAVAGAGAGREVELVFGLGLEAVEDLTERACIP